MYPYFKKENFQNALILLYTPLQNSNYFYSGFDRFERNRKEELWLTVLQRALLLAVQAQEEVYC